MSIAGDGPRVGVRQGVKRDWTPRAKQELRRICLERLKQDRQRLLDDYRRVELTQSDAVTGNWVRDVAHQIAEAGLDAYSDSIAEASTTSQAPYQQERPSSALPPSPSLPSVSVREARRAVREPLDISMREDDADVAIRLADDEYIDLLLFIEQSIKEEMQIQEGEEYLAREEADLDEESAALEEEWRLQEQDNIVCPLCGRQTVDVRYGTVMCKGGGCSFRLCVQDEGLDRDAVRERLDAAVKDHSQYCMATARFELNEDYDALFIKCGACGLLEVVL
ncbi:unnamed protein product [Vitrella brassicaformis CCMP3155]|uniref:RPA-interacting protein C-terminal domain-containing protein n=1 Tax=Vitrella brassicaformis (strain CCMP3155) TaxID=1169540 RepID=A0A0G4EKZ1_VITBC|nr:unnamed protein product [Vitrella brassicaformis CCMP3155]|eukprot:CEL98065.1 unnamed protein product [Vitrella brassicaformis CCMP3155]